MFILRLAAEAVNLGDEELSGHLTQNEDGKSLKKLPFPPSPPSFYANPIIFHFGRKRKEAKGNASDKHQKLFCSKRMNFDSSSEMSGLLECLISCGEESHNECKRFDRINLVKSTRLTKKRRTPLKNLYNCTNQGFSTQFSNLVNQMMIDTLGDQILSYHSSWVPPKEEPLDLSCKGAKLGCNDDNIRSIRTLVEPQFFNYSENKKYNTFPLSKLFEPPNSIPHNIEMLMNGAQMCSGFKSNFLGIMSQSDLNLNESVGLPSFQRRLKYSGVA